MSKDKPLNDNEKKVFSRLTKIWGEDEEGEYEKLYNQHKMSKEQTAEEWCKNRKYFQTEQNSEKHKKMIYTILEEYATNLLKKQAEYFENNECIDTKTLKIDYRTMSNEFIESLTAESEKKECEHDFRETTEYNISQCLICDETILTVTDSQG